MGCGSSRVEQAGNHGGQAPQRAPADAATKAGRANETSDKENDVAPVFAQKEQAAAAPRSSPAGGHASNAPDKDTRDRNAPSPTRSLEPADTTVYERLSRKARPKPTVVYRPTHDEAFELYIGPNGPGAETQRMLMQKQRIARESAEITLIDGRSSLADARHSQLIETGAATSIEALERRLVRDFEAWYDRTYGHLPARPPPGEQEAATKIQAMVRGVQTRQKDVLGRKRAAAARKQEITARLSKLVVKPSPLPHEVEAQQKADRLAAQRQQRAERQRLLRRYQTGAEPISATDLASSTPRTGSQPPATPGTPQPSDVATFRPTTNAKSAALAAAARERRAAALGASTKQLTLHDALAVTAALRAPRIQYAPSRDAAFDEYVASGPGRETQRMIEQKEAMLQDAQRLLSSDAAAGPSLSTSQRLSHAQQTADSAARGIAALEARLLADFERWFEMTYGHLPVDRGPAASAAATRIQALARGFLTRKKNVLARRRAMRARKAEINERTAKLGATRKAPAAAARDAQASTGDLSDASRRSDDGADDVEIWYDDDAEDEADEADEGDG